MKKFTLLTILIIIFAMSLPSESYSAGNYENSISGDPISLIFGNINVTFEHQVMPQNSFTVFASYWSYFDWTAWGIGGSFRWYIVKEPGKRILEGFSFGPFLAVNFWSWGGNTFLNDYAGGTTIAIGGEAAYKWVFSGFVVEPILRLAIPFGTLNGLSYRSFGIGCNLGYAW